MAEGDTWNEYRDGENFFCKEITNNDDELVVMKVGMTSGIVRYDRFFPNPNKGKYSHIWNDSNSKYGEHFENTSNNNKRKLGKIR